MRRSKVFAALLLLMSSCDDAGKPVTTSEPPGPARVPAEITILYTSDEHGWLLPFVDGGKSWGGAAEMLSQWVEVEDHCPGPVPAGEGQPANPIGCQQPKTLALSGGDNFTGPAISSYFKGESMAAQLGRMGYAMSAFGNHEYDFGRDQFLKNAAIAKLTYGAANLRVTDPALKEKFSVPAFKVFERLGIRVGVVALATDTTLDEAMASRFEGVTFDPEEPALTAAVKAAWAADPAPDVLVLIAHECPDKLKPILARHPEYKLSIALGAHCHKILEEHAGDLTILSPGWRFQHYIRVRMAIDPNRPPGERATKVLPQVVDLVRGEGDARGADTPLVQARTKARDKLDQALGEEIGYTATGFEKESPEIARWIAGAWRDEMKTDVGLVNSGGIRQGLPKGKITKASVWSILPFDNKMVVVSLKGSDLELDLANVEARAAFLPGPKKIVPDQRYSIATIDFIYAGGAKFAMKQQDLSPKDVGVDWRDPVIEWTKRLKTSPKDPLEKHVR